MVSWSFAPDQTPCLLNYFTHTISLFIITHACAHTHTQWYFGSPQPDAPQKGSRALRSLGHALGPSLGSLCLGSAVLTLMNLLRQVWLCACLGVWFDLGSLLGLGCADPDEPAAPGVAVCVLGCVV